MKLDLQQFANMKARRKKSRGGMGYLLSAVRRNLEERWRAVQGAQASSSKKVLLLDFAGSDFDLGERVHIQRISPPENPRVESRLSFDAQDEQNDQNNFDGVIMCLQPAWLEWPELLAHTLRALREGGTLLFCTFGPDTLLQLRTAWQKVDQFPHVHEFHDMHIIGDQLLRSGFARPIVDVDRITVEYENADLLHDDLRGEGFVNIHNARRKTLTGAKRVAGYRRELRRAQNENGAIAVTYELMYGAAAAPSSSLRVAPPQLRARKD